MSEKIEVKVTQCRLNYGTHRDLENNLCRKGDTVNLTENQIKAFGGKFTIIGEEVKKVIAKKTTNKTGIDAESETANHSKSKAKSDAKAKAKADKKEKADAEKKAKADAAAIIKADKKAKADAAAKKKAETK